MLRVMVKGELPRADLPSMMASDVGLRCSITSHCLASAQTGASFSLFVALDLTLQTVKDATPTSLSGKGTPLKSLANIKW